MNELARIGDNNPPDPIDEATAPYSDAIAEAENWLDGAPVENEGQMKTVDAILKAVKAAKSAVTKAEKAETLPLHDQWKAAKARYTPTIDDLDRMAKGLASIVGDFKKRIAAEKAEAERKARAEANRKMREAEEAARQAAAGDIEAQRAAAAKEIAAAEAVKAAQAAAREKVTGLRKVSMHEIDDHRAALHWIAKNDPDALTAFVAEYVRKNHKTRAIDGVRSWEEKEAF